MNLPERLKLVRVSKNLKISDIVKATNITSYSRIETGKMQPKFNQLLLICITLDIKIWELLAEELIITCKN